MADSSNDLPAFQKWSLRALTELFPAVCGVACEMERRPAPPLPEAEAAVVKTAAEARKISFAAGRAAARRALEKFGFRDPIIPAGADRAPVWPPGTIGSISHAGGLAVAVAARLEDLAAIGVDLERTAAVSRELWPNLMVAGETRFLNSLPEAEQSRFATAIFCIKEAFYKYQYPHARQWLDFREVEVELGVKAEEWKLTTQQPIIIGGKAVGALYGRYRIGNAFTLAAAC